MKNPETQATLGIIQNTDNKNKNKDHGPPQEHGVIIYIGINQFNSSFCNQ